MGVSKCLWVYVLCGCISVLVVRVVCLYLCGYVGLWV